MKKKLKWGFIGLIVLFLAAQAYQPDRLNPPVDESQTIFATLHVPEDVKAILERSCYDCHSNRTTWPWYSYIAPSSWLTANDVNTGRRMMNLSTWGSYKRSRMLNRLDQISDQLTNHEMPLKRYLLIHPNAKLSQDEVDLVSTWAEKERDRLMAEDSTAASGKK